MKEKRIHRILIMSIGTILLSVGLYFGMQFSDKVNPETDPSTEVINNNDNKGNENIQVYVDPKDQKTDIELVYEDYYKLSDETIKNSDMVYGISINDLKSQELKKVTENKSKYELVQETSTKLVFRREINQYSPNTFEVKIVEGKVIIYNVLSEDAKTTYKETDISESEIRPELLDELKKGMRVTSKDELNMLMEDIES